MYLLSTSKQEPMRVCPAAMAARQSAQLQKTEGHNSPAPLPRKMSSICLSLPLASCL